MSSSAGNTFSLPQEIMEIILYLLPVKSLGHFKSVSKTWCSFISDPKFIKKHFHQNKKFRKLISVSDTNSLYTLDLSELLPVSLNNDEDDKFAIRKELIFPIPIKWDSILGSCNGLVLAEAFDEKIYLINPATNEIKKLPRSPNKDEVIYGFGYDSSTNDYKVVSISFYNSIKGFTTINVSVFSLWRNYWTKLRSTPYNDVIGFSLSGVLVNQNLHWLTSKKLYDYSSKFIIAAFSLESRGFEDIELPDLIKNVKDCYLQDVGGKLGLFDQSQAGLWVMKKYGVAASWTKIRDDGLDIHPYDYVNFVRVSNRDIVLWDYNGVRVYNGDERRCRKVRVEGRASFVCSGGAYVDSLESPAKCIRW